MAKLSDKDIDFIRRQRKEKKKWKYFCDRLLLIGRISLKIGYVILFITSLLYALSGHNVPQRITAALNKINPVIIER